MIRLTAVTTRLWLLLVLLVATASCSGGSKPLSSASPPVAQPPSAALDAGVLADAPAAVDGASDAPQEAIPPDVIETEDEPAFADAGDPDASEVSEAEAWCPEGIEMLPGAICAVVPEGVAPDPAPTLVIFLHGITNVGSGWQIALIQGMARYAKGQHFALLAPRAPLQPHVEGKADVYAWRTSTLSPGGEEAMLDSWMAAKATLEGRMGHPFKQVFVMGFSSGAYYASSLALRGRPGVDGYAVFAGGSAPYSRGMLAQVKQRAPIFVGYGLRDKAGSRDARGLVAALRAARWKHRVMALRRAGHTITTSQFTSALAFLRAESAAGTAAAASPPTPASRPRHKGSKRRKH